MSGQGVSGDHRGGERLPYDWEASYAQTPPWDIGRPQAPFIALANAGHLHGAVLDVGCGTGEHALLAAEMGLPATGVDLAPTAIARARDKARQRGLEARFLVHDALAIDMLDETFDVILDCGFFHVLPDSARGSLVDVLGRVMARQGRRPTTCCASAIACPAATVRAESVQRRSEQSLPRGFRSTPSPSRRSRRPSSMLRCPLGSRGSPASHRPGHQPASLSQRSLWGDRQALQGSPCGVSLKY